MSYVIEKTSSEYSLMGGKATALSKLSKAIDNIPDFFVVAYTAYDKDKK